MAEIIPFRGLLYDTNRVRIEDVLAPPYDIISPEYREALYMQSPFNVVRVDFGKDEPDDTQTNNKYTRARDFLDGWIRDGVIMRSGHPSFYVYEIRYSIEETRKRLLGFLGLVKIEEFGKGSVYPHECTHAKPKQDRLNLMRSCHANTSPIFALYKSSGRRIAEVLSAVTETDPYISAKDISGDVHRLWQIDHRDSIELIVGEMRDKAIYIADGHHRYETAFEFYRENSSQSTPAGSPPFGYVLMFLADMRDEGLTILPTHRLLRTIPPDMDSILSRYFKTQAVSDDFDIRKTLSGKPRSFGFFRRGSPTWQILSYDENMACDICDDLRQTDVIILHELILKKIADTSEIGYEMDVRRALEHVRSGAYRAAFFLNPTRVEDVERAALSSFRMPPKSTYFYPKLLTGLVMNKW